MGEISTTRGECAGLGFNMGSFGVGGGLWEGLPKPLDICVSSDELTDWLWLSLNLRFLIVLLSGSPAFVLTKSSET